VPHILSLTKFSGVFPLKLNIHIVFEGEKEFHRNVKLWGVSIRIIFLLKKTNTTKHTNLQMLLFKSCLFFMLSLLIERNLIAYHSIIEFKSKANALSDYLTLLKAAG